MMISGPRTTRNPWEGEIKVDDDLLDFVIRTTPLWGRTIYAFPQDLKS